MAILCPDRVVGFYTLPCTKFHMNSGGVKRELFSQVCREAIVEEFCCCQDWILHKSVTFTPLKNTVEIFVVTANNYFSYFLLLLCKNMGFDLLFLPSLRLTLSSWVNRVSHTIPTLTSAECQEYCTVPFILWFRSHLYFVTSHSSHLY